jgi:flavin-dependent dehydrogenase
MTKRYDVVIVGAGPAGLMAAQTAAKQGLDVLLIEQKTKVASIGRTCVAGLVTEPGCHDETVTVEGDRIVFHRNDFSVRYSGQWQNIKGFYLISPAGYRIRMEREATHVSRIFNKEVLLEDLLAEAEKSGVHIEQGTKALKVKNIDDEVAVTIRSKGEEREVRGRFAIVADGANSRIVEELGLNKERKSFGTMGVCSYILEGVESPYPDAIINFLGKEKVSGSRGMCYFWPRSPRKLDDPPLWELLYTEREKNLEEILNRFIKEGTFSSWFNQSKVVGKNGSVTNVRTPIPEPRVGNIVVIGDAASFIEVLVQGAIMYGYRAAKAIIDEMKGNPGLDEFVQYWKDSYGYLKPGMIEELFGKGYYGIHYLEDSDLDDLFKLTDSKSYKGYYNSFTMVDTIRKALIAEKPKVMKERPDLFQKLKKLFETSILEEELTSKDDG